MDFLTLLLSLQKKTLEGEISWNFETNLPPIINDNPYETITSCFSFKDNVSGLTFYLYEYNYRYYTDEDEWYLRTSSSLALIKQGLIYAQSPFSLQDETSNLLMSVRSNSSISLDHLLS